MSDNAAEPLTATEEPEEEVFDVFETGRLQINFLRLVWLVSPIAVVSLLEKSESDYVVKTFDYGIAARQVHREGPDLQVITDDDCQAEGEVPELPNNVFNTIMNNLSLVDKTGEKVKAGKAKMFR